MAIKEVLELIGDDVVIKKLENVKKAGEESLAVFSKPLPDLKFPDAPTIDSKPVQEFTGHISKLSDVLKILKPALSEAGIAVGGLGTFGRLANASLAGLAAALGGAIVVKLADIEENAAKTKRALSDLFGSTAAGEAAFKGLEASARSLHTTTADLLPSVESLARGLAKFRQEQTAGKFVALKREDLPAGLSQNQEAVNKAIDNFFKILRAGGLSTSEATAAEKEFFAVMRSGGQITADMLEKLPTGTVELLAQALGKGAITAEQFISEVAKAPISIDKVSKGLANFTKQSQAAFDANAVRSYKDAFQDLLTFIEDGLKSATGKGFSEFLSAEIDKFKADLTGFFRDLKAAKDAFFNIPGPPIPGISAPAGAPTQAQKDLVNKFADTGKDIAQNFKRGTDQIQSDSAQAASKVTQDWVAFGQQFKTMIDQVVESSRTWTDAIKSVPKFKFVTPPAPGEDPFAGQRGGISPTTGTTTSGAILGATFTGAPKIDTVGAATFTGNVTFASFSQPGFPPGGGGRIPPPPEFRKASFDGADGGDGQGIGTENLVGPFQDAATRIGQIWTRLMEFISTSVSTIDLSGATSALVAPFEAAIPLIQQALSGVGQAVDDLLRKLQEAQSSTSQLGAFAQGGFGGGLAAGGMVHGPGSTTSDSIMAWLSRGEYVVNARATSAYLPLLQAINGMRLPLGPFNSNKFAGGGMVSSAGNRSLTLVLNQKQFSLSGSKGTIDDLEREASLRGLAMIGKAPSWIR